jgi:hypothetical protein
VNLRSHANGVPDEAEEVQMAARITMTVEFAGVTVQELKQYVARWNQEFDGKPVAEEDMTAEDVFSCFHAGEMEYFTYTITDQRFEED